MGWSARLRSRYFSARMRGRNGHRPGVLLAGLLSAVIGAAAAAPAQVIATENSQPIARTLAERIEIVRKHLSREEQVTGKVKKGFFNLAQWYNWYNWKNGDNWNKWRNV